MYITCTCKCMHVHATMHTHCTCTCTCIYHQKLIVPKSVYAHVLYMYMYNDATRVLCIESLVSHWRGKNQKKLMV